MMQPLADESLAALERNASTATVPGVDLPLREVVARLPRQIRHHQVAALAGNLAFRLVLTILPGLLALTWLLHALHAEGAIGGLLEGAQLIVPGPAGEAVTEQVQNAPQKQAEGDLSFAAALSGLVALGSLILACRAFLGALNVIHEVTDGRTTMRRQLISICMTVGVVLLLFLCLALLTAADEIARWLGIPIGDDRGSVAWSVLGWSIALVAGGGAVALLYHFAPDTGGRSHRIGPGTYFAITFWIAFTIAFSLYLNYLAHPNQTYGPLAGVAMLMLYLYGTVWVVLLGAEMNHLSETHEEQSHEVRTALGEP